MPVQKNVVGDQPLVRVLAGQVVCLHCRVEVYHAVISNDGVGSRTNDMEGMFAPTVVLAGAFDDQILEHPIRRPNMKAFGQRKPESDFTRSNGADDYGATESARASDLNRSSRELVGAWRSEEHTSELQSLMRISYAVFCLKKKK